MESRPKDPKLARNKNVMVIGGSGSGKTRFFVKPNLMQMHSSYVVTDPKGQILVECGMLLKRNGYRIKVLNTIDFQKSMHYNPFAYIRSEKDILKLVNAIIMNTKGEGEKAGEDFWIKAERLYYSALIGYIWYEAPMQEKNFTTLLEMIDASEAREEDETFKNEVDEMFEELEAKDPDHFAVRQYKKYKLAAGKTAKSILISCGARLAPFDIRELRELMSYDEMELDTLGDRKTALFVIISDTDDTFNFVVAILYTQLFNLLCDKADNEYGGRLPIHVRCLLDEFPNIGQIPRFERLIATIRSREISACVVLQAQSQLRAIYKDHAETINGNCDSLLFLGGKEKSTLGKRIGQTIGTVADTKDRMVDTASGLKEQVKDLPTNARYAVYQGKSKVKENVRDLTSSISQTKADRASGRKEQQEQRRKTIAKRRSEMEQVKQKKQPASSVHERPTTRQEQYHDEQTSKQSNIQTSYKESQQAKQERPAVKSDFSSPKVERQGNTVQEKTVQKPATSTTTADRTSQRPITKERPSTVQRVPLQNTRSRPPIKTATIKKVGRNHEVENFSDWWFWIILDGLLTASVCCHFIFR